MRYKVEVEQIITFTHVIEFESGYSESAVEDILNDIDGETKGLAKISQKMEEKGLNVKEISKDKRGECYSCMIDMLEQIEE